MEGTSDYREAAKQDADGDYSAAAAANQTSSKQVGRKVYIDRWFRFLLQQYKADEMVDIPLAKVILFCHFAILAISITSWNGFEEKYLRLSMSSTSDLIARVLIGALIVITVSIFATGYLQTSDISSKPSSVVYVCSVLKYLHWYIVMPACFMLFSRDLFGVQADTPVGRRVTSWLIMSVALVIYVFIIYMRSQLPSSCKFNSPNRLAEMAVSMVYFILVCANKNMTAQPTYSVFEIVSIAINIFGVSLAWQTQIFWWNSINTFYMIGHLFIVVARISFKVFDLAFDSDISLLQLLVFTAVAETVAMRLGHTYGIYRLIQRMKNCQNASNIDNFILFFTYDLCKQAADDKLGEQIPRPLLFEMSQIGRLSLYNTKRRQRLLNDDLKSNTGTSLNREAALERIKLLKARFESEAKDPLWAFYIKFSEQRPNTEDELFCYLLLQLIFLGKNVMSISSTLSQFRKLLGPSHHESFQFFLIESMFQGRLEHLSIEDSTTEHFSRTNLGEVMSEISKDLAIIQEHETLMTEYNLLAKLTSQKGLSTSTSDENATIRLDLSRVLMGKYEYLQIVSQINKLINIKTDVFSNLFQQPTQKSHYLYRKNEIAMRHAKELDRSFTKLLSTDLVGNYVLASAVCYFLKIRYDSQRSEKIFKLYQSKLSKYHAMTLIPLKAITEANFQYNSIVMRVNIAQESTLGLITDISPNYKEYMGEPANNEPTKINLNTLFPGQMSPDHVLMMKATADQPIFNVQKDFQMNGFDGYLKPVRYILKLDPMISAGLHSICLLRFKTITHRCLLLANDRLDLVSAEKDFWKMMKGLRAKADINKISILSQSLAVHVVWTKFLRTVEVTQSGADGSAESTRNLIGGDASDLFNNLTSQSNLTSEQAKILAKDIAYNQLKLRVLECFSSFDSTGIFHQMSPELGLPMEMSDLPILASVENTKFGKANYFRIWITFDTSHSKERKDTSEELILSKTKHNTMRDQRDCKLTDSENKVAYTASIRSVPRIQTGLAGLDSEFYNTAATYEKILMKAKSNSPIMTLLNEASGRTYPDDVREALTWIENYYKFAHDDAGLRQGDTYKGSKGTEKLAKTFEVPPSPGEPDVRSSSISGSRGPDSNAKKSIHFRLDNPNDLTYSDGGNSYRLGSGEVEHHNVPQANKVTSMPQHRQDSLPVALDQPPNSKPRGSLMSAEPNSDLWQPSDVAPGSSDAAMDVGTASQQPKPKPRPAEQHQQIRVLPVKGASSKTKDSHSKQSKDAQPQRLPSKSSMKKINESGKFFNLPTKKNKSQKVRKIEMAKQETKQQQAKVSDIGKHTEDYSHNLKSSKHEASYDDVRSQRTSVFSQLAKNLFKYKTGRGATTGSNTTDFEGKEDLTPAALTKMAGDNALISHNPNNIQLITKYISDYKLIRRTETNPDERNNSISSRSSTSRGTHFLKLVNTVMDTKKGGTQMYLLTLGSIAFSIYFGIVLQYVLSSLKSYNVSNLNNFILLSNFIFLDRKLMESCETQDFLYEHTAAAWNYTEYDMIRTNYAKALPTGINSTDLLFTLMNDAVNDISFALRAVTDETINLIDKKDAGDVVRATYRPQELDYTDRFIANATIYRPWDMPYIGTIIYYMDIFRQNKDALIAINQQAWVTNNSFELDTRMNETWRKATSSKQSLDSTVFNKVLQVMDTNFSAMVDSIILTAVTRHFRDIYILLYLSIGVVGLLTGYIIFAAIKINVLQKDYLMNYNMLRPWELFIMIEDLAKIRSNFTKFAYNEIEQLNQYLDFNLFSSLATFSVRVNRLQEHFYRDKDKASKVKKFTHDFFFFSSKFLLVFIILTGSIFGIMGLAIYIFLSINTNRIGVEMLLFDSHIHMIGIMKSYLSVTLLQIYGYYLPIAGTSISADAFSREFDKFLVFQTGKRSDFIFYFGEQNSKRIDSIAFSNLCAEMLTVPTLKARYSRYTEICSTINQGAATKGIIGFLQYQKYYLDSMRTRVIENYKDWLRDSVTTVPARSLTNELFTTKFIEMRIGNWIAFNVYYYVMSEMATNAVTDIKNQLEYYVSEVMQYISVSIYLVLVAVYWYALTVQSHEIQVCYETFKLIDPFFLMNNRYLQFRFKEAYKGIG